MKIKSAGRLVPVGLIAIAPLAYVAAYLALGEQKGPYWLRLNQDPDYAYLVNSLAIANFETPGHTDHPGTPVQVLGAVTLWLTHAVQSLAQSAAGQPALDLNESVLSNPERYLNSIDAVLLGLGALSVFALGLAMYWLSHRLLLALLVQLTPLLLVKTIVANEASRVAPEPLIFALSQVLVALLAVYLFRPEAPRTRWFALSLGVVFGLGMATKVTFLPAIVFGLAIAGYRLKLLALGTAIVTFVVATLPIVSEYQRVWQWMTGIAVNSEKYGKGSPGLPSLDILQERLITLSEKNAVFFCLLGIVSTLCLIAVFLTLFRRNPSAEVRPEETPSAKRNVRCRLLTIGVTVSMWMQLLMTIIEFKHARYLVLSVGFSGLLLVLMVLWVESIPLYRARIPYSASAAALVVYALCLGGSIQQYDVAHRQISSRVARHLKEVQEIDALLGDARYQDCAVALELRASAQRSALLFANRWSDSIFAETSDVLYPNSAFAIRNSLEGSEPFSFRAYSGKINASELLNQGNGCILLKGRPILSGKRTKGKVSSDAIAEDLLPRHRDEKLYRIRFNDAVSAN